LTNEERELLYYAMFKKENAVKLSQRLFCHETTISVRKKEAVIKLMEQIIIDTL